MAGLDEGQQQIPETILFQGHRTYRLNDLITFDRAFFVGCIREPRTAIQKKNIPGDQYWFATYSKRNDTWSPATPESKKANVLICEEWVHNNLPKFTGDETVYKYKPLPALIQLEEHEKFRDQAGNVYEVEVRGEKTKNGIWFKCKDVCNVFEMETLDTNIARMLDQTEYKVFYPGNPIKNQTIQNYQVLTYLTYNGLLKIISSSRSYNIKNVSYFMEAPLMRDLINQSNLLVILKPYKEQQTIQAIKEAFPKEIMHTQYNVGSYRVDLYIKDKLIVECDENDHSDRDAMYEYKRETYIQSKLKCPIFRFNPDEPGFSVYKLIRDLTEIMEDIQKEKTQYKEQELDYDYKEIDYEEYKDLDYVEYKERELKYKEQVLRYKKRELDYKRQEEKNQQELETVMRKLAITEQELETTMRNLSISEQKRKISEQEHKRYQDVLSKIVFLTPAQRQELANMFEATRAKMDPFLSQ
jgi:hypothetical protein